MLDLTANLLMEEQSKTGQIKNHDIGILVKFELCIPLESSFQSLSVHVLNVHFTVSYDSEFIVQSELMI